MAETGYPVCFDATISSNYLHLWETFQVDKENSYQVCIRSAANGINLLFMETHDNPSHALSDANTVLDIKYLEYILYQSKKIHNLRLELKKELGPDIAHKNI